MLTIAAGILLVLTLAYLAVILLLCGGLLSLKASGQPRGLTYSVVIAAHNEEANIDAVLNSVFAQGLPAERYEVILVNDRSTDDTAARAQAFSARHPNLCVITIAQVPPGISPKKHAVSTGIARARHEIIVLTDADCLVPSTWLATIDRNFENDTGLVQGITTYVYVDGIDRTFFGLQAIDFLSHGIVAAGAIGAGIPLNSNANNMAFRRGVFEAVGGYGSVGSVVSGDDDLLLQKVWASRRWEIRYMNDAAGAVQTLPTPTIHGVFEQRKRWASKTVHYNARQVAVLATVFAFYLGIPGALVLGALRPSFALAALGMLAVKLAGEAFLLVPGTAMFKQAALRPYIAPASVIQLPLVLYAVIGGVFGRFNWKGQRFGRRAVRGTAPQA